MVPIGEALADLGGPVKAIRDASPQALHHFTQADQVDQLVTASEADPDLGFMARMMALCSLPRTNPGNRLQYKRVNGPFKLIMIAGGDNKLPYGNLPRLILAWISTEVVRTRSRVIVLGPSLAKFMHADVSARSITILGHLQGNVKAGERTEIRKTGSFDGELLTAQIVIKDGAVFRGSVDVVKPPGRTQRTLQRRMARPALHGSRRRDGADCVGRERSGEVEYR